MRMPRALTPFGFALVVAASTAVAQAPVDFTNDIRPIMERSCWNCHGDALQLSGLDLTSRENALKGGDRGPAIVPGRAEDSRLYRAVAGLVEPAMPMEGDALSASEIASVRDWINDGAHWDSGATTTTADALAALEGDELPPGAREYWAFKLPKQAPIPEVSGFEHPIDRFLERTRRDNGLTAAPRADRLTLMRRAYLDLIGLPPTPEQTAAFVIDEDEDEDAGAWERLIDRLLASPHCGERWVVIGSTWPATRTRAASSTTAIAPTHGATATTSSTRSTTTNPTTSSSKNKSLATSSMTLPTRPGSLPDFFVLDRASCSAKKITPSGGTTTSMM